MQCRSGRGRDRRSDLPHFPQLRMYLVYLNLLIEAIPAAWHGAAPLMPAPNQSFCWRDWLPEPLGACTSAAHQHHSLGELDESRMTQHRRMRNRALKRFDRRTVTESRASLARLALDHTPLAATVALFRMRCTSVAASVIIFRASARASRQSVARRRFAPIAFL